MSNQFIGLHVCVTVRKDGSEFRVKGTVVDIEAGNSLTLSNVWLLNTNGWLPRMTIEASDIFTIQEMRDQEPQDPETAAPASASHASTTQVHSTVPRPSQQTAVSYNPPRAPFVDPAILSIGKRPGSTPQHGSDSQTQLNAGEKVPRPPIPTIQIGSIASELTPTETAAPNLTPTGTVPESTKGSKIENNPLQAPVESADEDAHGLDPDAATQDAQGAGKKRNKKRGRKKTAQEKALLQAVSGESPHQDRANQANRGTGWRQTPILQSTSSFQPFNSLKKSGSRGRNENGWASEDVTDVQEAGDFDFEGGLAKFDKSTLFDQMRKEDQVDEAERLVSHNRQARPKPGTAGGKNLHHSENVLDMPATSTSKQRKDAGNDFWNSEADDGALNGGERQSGRELGSRQSSRRGESRLPPPGRSQSRKASAAPIGGQAPIRVNSGVSSRTQRRGSRGSRVTSTGVDNVKQLSSAAPSPGFYLIPSNRRVEPVSALQMLNLENIAHNELGFTDEMMTENAGRGIAEVALATLTDPAIQVRTAGSVDPATGNIPPPTIVILAGNNKSGARAVAAGRHLRNKNINVLVCVVGMDRGTDNSLLEEMKQQVRLFRSFGGRIYNKGELFEHLRKASIPTLSIDAPRTSLGPLANPAPVTLIIDALLGLAISFEELRTSDQAAVYELIEWANRNEAFVLAVDLPTGIDPSSGKINIIDGGRLYVKPRYVVSIAAPKRGLLDTIMDSDGGGDDATAAEPVVSDDPATEWKLFVVDMGFGSAVWKKAGTKIRRGIDFDDKWVCEMRYRGAPTEGGEDA